MTAFAIDRLSQKGPRFSANRTAQTVRFLNKILVPRPPPHTPRINPPSTRKFCPVMYPAPSDTRNATVAAISSARP